MHTTFKYQRKGGPEQYAGYSTAVGRIIARDLTGEQLIEWHVARATDDAERRSKRVLRMGGCESMRPTEVTKYAKKAAARGCPPWNPNATKSLQQRVTEAHATKREAQRALDAADIEIGAVKEAVLEHHKALEAKARGVGQVWPSYDRLTADISDGVATVTPWRECVARAGYGGSYYIEHCDEHDDPFEYTYRLEDL